MHLIKSATLCFIHTVSAVFLFASVVRSSENMTKLITSAGSFTPTLPTYLLGKDESLLTCLAVTLEQGEYELFPNGTLYSKVYNISLNESLYIQENNSVTLCKPYESGNHIEYTSAAKATFLTLIGLFISMICLFLHLVAFAVLPDMRNLPGWNLAALCFSLLCSCILLVLLMSRIVVRNHYICVTVASLTHFFWLYAFLWMSIISFDVLRSLLSATRNLRISSNQFRLKLFAVYNLCSFGVALIISVLGIVADRLDAIPEPYKPEFETMCWFNGKTSLLIFFGGPVIALTCINFIFFALSTYIIHTNKMKSNEDNQTRLRSNYLRYFRLFVIMGITWSTGIVAAIFKVAWLWYLFVFLNSLQGLFIFLGFTCSEKVKNIVRKKLSTGSSGS